MISLLFYELFEIIQREKILEHDFKSQFLDIVITKVVSKFSWISERVRWIKIALKIVILSERVTHNSRWFTT